MTKTPELANRDQLAQLLGIRQYYMRNTIRLLVDFPACEAKQGRFKLYRVSAVMAWAEGKDLPALVRASWAARSRAINHGKRHAVKPFNQLAVQMLRGDFLPATQRRQKQLKLLACRVSRPKTTRVSLQFDWMLEDGPHAKYRSTTC